MQIVYKFKPQGEILHQYLLSKKRVAFIMGPLGSGKTWTSCEKLFKIMCNQAPNRNGVRLTRLIAVRNTYPDLMNTTVKDWLEKYEHLGRFTAGTLKPPTHDIKFKLKKDNSIVKSELIFLALDRPDAVRRLRGIQATAFWLNEIKELARSIVDMCDLRHGRYPSKADGGPSWHGMIGDTNACEDDHWFYEIAEGKYIAPDWDIFKQPGGVYREYIDTGNGHKKWTGRWLPNMKAENLNNLPDNYYINGMQNKKNSWIAVNLANEYGHTSDGKPVYEESWNDTVHVAQRSLEYDLEKPVLLGWDYGRTPSVIIAQVNNSGRGINVIDEITSEHTSIRAFGPIVKHFLLEHGIPITNTISVGDKSGKNLSQTTDDSPETILAEYGFHLLPDATADIQTRLEAVEYYLSLYYGGQPQFQLNPSCRVVRAGFNGGYSFHRVQIPGELRYSDKPKKNRYSHPHDALQSICMYLRQTPNTSTVMRKPETPWAMV